MQECYLCEQDGENPICNQNDGSITYFCNFHYAQAMGKDIGMLDRLKHTFRNRGGSMRGKPQKMSKLTICGVAIICSICIFIGMLGTIRMFADAPLETYYAFCHISVEVGLGLLGGVGLGWKIHWKDKIKTLRGRGILALTIVVGIVLIFYPILSNLDIVLAWIRGWFSFLF